MRARGSQRWARRGRVGAHVEQRGVHDHCGPSTALTGAPGTIVVHAPTIDATAVSSATHTAGAGPIDIRNPAVLNNMAAQTPGAATPDSCSAELHSVVDSCAGHVTCRPHSHSTRCRGRQVVGVSSSTDPVLAPQVPVAADGCLHLPELRPACILWHIVVTVPLRLTSRQFLIQPHTAALAARTRSTNEGRPDLPAAQHGCVERAVSTEYLYRRPASMYVRK